MTKKIKILFFGATAEIVLGRELTLEMKGPTTSSSIFENLVAQYPRLANHRLHYSINEQYATGDEILNDGDEIAIFTAVSGG